MSAAPISLTLTKDEITPSLTALVSDELKERMLQAAGTLLSSMGQRAFDEPGLRPYPWERRQDKKPHPLLIKSGDLRQSLHHQVEGDTVKIGSPKAYAAVHQLGSARKGIPLRPFFPVLHDKLTGEATAELDDIMAGLIGSAAGQ